MYSTLNCFFFSMEHLIKHVFHITHFGKPDFWLRDNYSPKRSDCLKVNNSYQKTLD